MKKAEVIKNGNVNVSNVTTEKTEEQAADFIKNYLERRKNKGKGNKENYELKIAKIKSTICTFYGMELGDYNTRTRKQEFVKLRYVTYYFVNKNCPLMSFESIGKILGYDHATVMHAITDVKDQCDTNKDFRSEINELDAIISYEMTLIDNKSINTDDYYFINLDNIKVLRFSNNKSIVFSGISDEDIKSIQKGIFKDNTDVKSFNKTGLHLLRKLEA